MKKIYKSLGLIALALVLVAGATSANAAMPINPSVMINAGAATTSSLSVTLSLSATGANMMEVSNDSTFNGAVWETFMTSKSWTLTSGDGTKTVYARFRDSTSNGEDNGGNISSVVSASINVSGSGTTAPIVILGCGNTNVGFSPLTGQSCATNTVVGTASIPGCGDRNFGFSVTTGQSCSNNSVTGNSGDDNGSMMSEDNFDFGNETLKDGSMGQPVMDLQKFLNKFENENLSVDGKLGPQTISIIKKWQSDHGLTADGLIGAKTKMQMENEVSSKGGSSSNSGSGNSSNSMMNSGSNNSGSGNSGNSGDSGDSGNSGGGGMMNY